MTRVIETSRRRSGSAPAALGGSLPARMIESNSGVVRDVTSLATFNTAWNASNPGDTIRIRAGSYGSLWQFGIGTQNTHKIQISDSNLSSFGPVTIENYPGENISFTGTGTTNAGLWYFNDCKGVRVRANPAGGTFTAIPGSAAGTPCLKFDGCWDSEIDGLIGHDTGGTLYSMSASSSAGATYGYGKNNQVWNVKGYNWSIGNTTNQAHAIYFGSHHTGSAPDGTYGGCICNCLFYTGQGGYGLHTGDSAHDLVVANNTVDGAPYGGGIIWTQGTTTDPTGTVLYVNNIMTNCGALATSGLNGTGGRDFGSITPGNAIRECMGFGNKTVTDFSRSNSNLVIGTVYHQDPKYVNRAGGDFHLDPSSPALGLGDPDYCPQRDHDGNLRSQVVLGAF